MVADDKTFDLRRKALREKLLRNDPVSLHHTENVDDNYNGMPYRCEVIDNDGHVIFCETGDNLEKLVVPHIKIIIEEEEMSLTDIENTSNWDILRVFQYLKSLISVSGYFYSTANINLNSHNPCNDEPMIALCYLIGNNSWGERIKLKVGTETIMSKDLGKYMVARKSSVNIVTKACGTELFGAAFPVLQVVKEYLQRILDSYPIPIGINYQDWKVG